MDGGGAVSTGKNAGEIVGIGDRGDCARRFSGDLGNDFQLRRCLEGGVMRGRTGSSLDRVEYEATWHWPGAENVAGSRGKGI
jgi:hypothetical protein